MSDKRKLYIVILVMFTALASIVLFKLGHKAGISHLANNKLDEDILQLNLQIFDMERESENVRQDISRIDSSLSDQSFLNDYILENRDLYTQLNKDISEAKETISQLDSQIESKRETVAMLDGISNKEYGNATTITPDKTYDCPKDFEPGRYRVFGTGTLLVYGRSNSLRVSENLAILDSNSFTFNLEENERIKIDEQMEIVKTN